MLALEDQLCSLEHAKRFDELGIKQKSLFVYQYHNDDCYSIQCKMYGIVDCLKIYSAFTVAELGEMLPKELKNHNNKYFPYELTFKWELHYSDNKMWHVTYNSPGYDGDVIEDFLIYDKKEADARAKMLIYLIKKNLITAEEINKCPG